MYDTNVKIIAELKEFLHLAYSKSELLDRFRSSSQDFIRSRKLPFSNLILLITKLCKRTLSFELEDFFKEINNSMPCSVSAFTQQRAKLQPIFFKFWNMVLWSSFYFYAGANVKRWKGYRIVAGDGSSITLVNTSSLSKYFGGQSNQKASFVLAKTFYHYDVLNELILTGDIKPYRYGEVNMAYDAINEVNEDMVMIYDRNFSSFKMIALLMLQEKERKFVIRAKETQNIIRSFIEGGQSSSIIHLSPTPSAIEGLKNDGYLITKDTQLKVRLVRVDLGKSIEVLITNLWEEDGHPDSEFKDLYFMRWSVETNISFQKNILQVESFSGLSVNAVIQDFMATVFVANLHSILIKDAQSTVETKTIQLKYPMKVNKNKSYGRLKTRIVSLFLTAKPRDILHQLHDHFIKDPIPIRKGRSFERVRKNTKARTKHRTFTNYKLAC